MNGYWDWILSIVGVAGFILAGKRVWWAWWINVAAQGLWFAYAIITEQYGFLIGAVIYTVVFLKNAVEWTVSHRRIKAIEEVSQQIPSGFMKGYAEADVKLTEEPMSSEELQKLTEKVMAFYNPPTHKHAFKLVDVSYGILRFKCGACGKTVRYQREIWEGLVTGTFYTFSGGFVGLIEEYYEPHRWPVHRM